MWDEPSLWNPTNLRANLYQSHSEANSGCGWFEGLDNTEGISVGGLPNGIQERLKVVVREIRKLDEGTDGGFNLASFSMNKR